MRTLVPLRSIIRFRACCAVQAPVGCVVAPRIRIRPGVFDHREDVDGGAVEVRAVKKSTARMAADGGRSARDNDAGEFACMRR